MMEYLRMGLLILLGVGLMLSTHASENRWESAIAAFEAQDKKEAPEKNEILFLGSSSIRMWDIKKFFPDLPALNRGFGGSTIADVNLFFDRLVTVYAPRTIVFYSGDNDIANGNSAEEVLEDFKTFFTRLRTVLPETRLVLISIKPSIARWHCFKEIHKANALLQEYVLNQKNTCYVDSETTMLNQDGKPDKSLLLEDGLHLNEAGYTAWTKLVVPCLQDDKKE